MDTLDRRAKEKIILDLFRTFAQNILAVAYYVVQDHALAEDIVQETFLTAMDKLYQLNDLNKAGGWLKRIAINKAYSEMRKRQRTFPQPVPWVTDDSSVEDTLIAKEEALLVCEALDRLSGEHQMVLFLKYFRGLTVKEIAAALNAPEATVKSRLQRSRELFYRHYHRKAGVQG
ncbi:MAG: sigma-70 family RNA polymerase sigma factor [Thermoanaerobacterales bacterium]|nr:sigma-70 family RNA polymerase sigma factor [Thermoanaerobacterales bacterium]